MYKFDVWTQYIVHARFIMITAGSMLILLRNFQRNPSIPLSSFLLSTFLFSCFISAPFSSRFREVSFVLVLILWSLILRGKWQIKMESFFSSWVDFVRNWWRDSYIKSSSTMYIHYLTAWAHQTIHIIPNVIKEVHDILTPFKEHLQNYKSDFAVGIVLLSIWKRKIIC